ncbi:MAG: SUMF1/EgtB/PvdO family nonheme iron enzyme, partial [Chthoniobacteraceae bacterium]
FFSIWDTRVKDYAEYARVNTADDTWTKEEKDGVPVSREPECPVVGVSWSEATAFCVWLTEKETAERRLPKGMRYRLPTDEEWSRAAGLAKEDGVTPREKNGNGSGNYPWGVGFPPTKGKAGNYADAAFHGTFPNEKNWIEGYSDGYATTSPVGSFAPNQYGLFDMSGNVWQWCEDPLEPGSAERVLRGASWNNCDPIGLLSSSRYHGARGYRSINYGFRCVLGASER